MENSSSVIVTLQIWNELLDVHLDEERYTVLGYASQEVRT